MKLEYIITGDVSEISSVVENLRAEKRFLSDTPNISDYKWYPLDAFTQVVEVVVEKPVDPRELELLTADLTSLTIGRLIDGVVHDVISAGESEAVVDSTNTTR